MKEQLIDYLIDNQGYFKEKYKSLFDKEKALKTEEATVFHPDIDYSLQTVIYSSMSNELARATGADMETIMIVLEDMNMETYFK